MKIARSRNGWLTTEGVRKCHRLALWSSPEIWKGNVRPNLAPMLATI